MGMKISTLTLAAVVAATLVPAAGADAKALKGTVVHRSAKAQTFVVANAKGRLSSVHARHRPKVGRRVAFKARGLANGTFATNRKLRFHGRSHHARVGGTVTFVDAATRTFTVSDNGASILVRLADTTKALPAVGDKVLVLADLDSSTASQIEALDVLVKGDHPAGQAIEIEGVVLAIDESTRTLTLSADDDDESGEMIAVTLPDSFDLTAFQVGDSVELLATLNADGQTFTATGATGDDDADEADDHGDDQGDGFDDHGQRGDHDDGDADDDHVSAADGDHVSDDDSSDSTDDHSGSGRGGDDD
jgi:hypothetical protein